MADKFTDKKLFLGLAGLFIILGAVYALSLGPVETPDVSEIVAADIEQPAQDDSSTANTSVAFNLEKAKKERVLGDPGAPIKITEHSSLTCGHCAHFHKDTLGPFKSQYIDTGKAYIVFSDFPLNAPALHATMAARCIDDDAQYFAFVQDLFKTQELWAGERNYVSYLKDKAAQYGLDARTFNACIQSQALQDALLKRMQAVQQQWKISSTPSFVVNNQEVISGALPFEAFEQALQDALDKINTQEGE